MILERDEFGWVEADTRLARLFATAAHRGQWYRPEKQIAYIHHVELVADMVLRVSSDQDAALVCSAWLHDVVEDTNFTLWDIERLFGTEVRDIVDCVTDVPAPNRTLRKTLTLPKTAGNRKAVLIKVLDRLANVAASLQFSDEKKFLMYQKEHPVFYEFLYEPGEYELYWTALNTGLEMYTPGKLIPLR